MKKDFLPTVIALLFSVGFLAALAALFIFPVPTESKETVTVMIQALIGVVLTIVGFLWGSSAGSRSKDESKKEPPQ